MAFRKWLLFCLLLFFLLHFSSASASSYSVEDFENWIHLTPPCDQSKSNSQQVREIHKLKGSTSLSAEFYCAYGNKTNLIIFFDPNGILFSSSIHLNEPAGIALSHGKREKIYVWKNSHLVPFETIPLLQTAQESQASVGLTGLYRVNFARDFGGTIYSFKDGVLDGPLVTISESSTWIRRTHRSQALKEKLKYRIRLTYYQDGVPYQLQDLKSSSLGFSPPNSTFLDSTCQPIPEGQGTDSIEKLRALDRDLPMLDWTLDPKNSVFRTNAYCPELSQGKSVKYKDGIKVFESNCYLENFGGQVLLNNEKTGKFLFLGNYKDGLPDGDFIIGSSDGVKDKFLFKEGKPTEFCSTRFNPIDFTRAERSSSKIGTNSRTSEKPRERTPAPKPNTGLLGFTIEKGTREKWAGGIVYSPNFHTDGGIGAIGAIGVLEALSIDEGNMLTRASLGYAGLAMFLSTFGTLGVRLNSSQISGFDLTLGFGFFTVIGFARGIYNERVKGLSGEVGFKFILPISIF